MIIDARAAARHEIGGVERVTIEMAARLPRLRPDRYAVMMPPAALAYRAGHLWEQALLPAAARNARVLYCPANLAPAVSKRTVVVINDLAALRHPGWYSSVYASYQQQILPLLARRARLVIAPSEFARQELGDGLGLHPDRVAVVPHGVDDRFSPDADAEPVKRRYGLRRPYVLVVGTRIARKNLASLAVARSRLAEHGIELVSAGSGRAYMRPGETPPMRALGYVDDEDLPGLYAGAVALTMPSLYEGFGLPVLEAMASGIPVVAADRTALPETCGDAALLIDPDDGEGMADALLQAAGDAGTRERLVKAGLERAAHFSWQRTARADRRGDRRRARGGGADRPQPAPVFKRHAGAADGRGGVDDHRQPRAPRPAGDLPHVDGARAARGRRRERADRRGQRLGRRVERDGPRALPAGEGRLAGAQRGLRRRRHARDRGGAGRVDRRLQQRHHDRARRRGRDAGGGPAAPARRRRGGADALRRPARRAQLGRPGAGPARDRRRPAGRQGRPRARRAGALRGLRRHRRRRAVPALDARAGRRLRRDLLRVLRGRRPGLARPRLRLARAVRAGRGRLPPPLRHGPARLARRSSTSSAATGCARSPRTRPPGCWSATGWGCSPTTPPT